MAPELKQWPSSNALIHPKSLLSHFLFPARYRVIFLSVQRERKNLFFFRKRERKLIALINIFPDFFSFFFLPGPIMSYGWAQITGHFSSSERRDPIIPVKALHAPAAWFFFREKGWVNDRLIRSPSSPFLNSNFFSDSYSKKGLNRNHLVIAGGKQGI